MQCLLPQQKHLGDDPWVVAAQFAGGAEDFARQHKAFPLFQQNFLGQKANRHEAEFVGDALGEGVGGAAFGQTEVEPFLGKIEPGLHEGGANARCARVGVYGQTAEFATQIGICSHLKIDRGRADYFAIYFG